MHEFTWLSPYAYAANNPIKLIDLDGKGPDDPCCVNSNFKTFWLGYQVLLFYGNDNTVWSDVGELNAAYNRLWEYQFNHYSTYENNVKNFDRAWTMYETIAYMHRQNPKETIKRVEEIMSMEQGSERDVKIIDFFTWAKKRKGQWANLELGMMGLDVASMGLAARAYRPKNKTYNFQGIVGNRVKVDLMGGKNTNLRGYINFDKQANPMTGITDDVANFKKYFGKGSVDKIVVNNPQAKFLDHVTESVKSGGTITIRGQKANQYFKEIWDQTSIPGYKIKSRKSGLSKKGYTRTDGEPLRGKEDSMNEIVLEKM